MAGVSAPGKIGSHLDEAGLRLRRVRESLGLRFRDVDVASQKIASHYGNEEYCIGLSRLSDIENRGVVPSIFRLYSLATIYRMSFVELVSWYGIEPGSQAVDSRLVELESTHLIDFAPNELFEPEVPLELDPGLDVGKTSFLSRFFSRWGPLPMQLFQGIELKKKRYAMMGSEDWSMYPILKPGSVLLIQETNRIAAGGWTDEWDRPIYFLMRREGYHVGWCHLEGDRLILMGHPSSNEPPKVFHYPNEIELVGQVVGVAMSLGTSPRRKQRRASEL